MFLIQPEVLAWAQQPNDAINECYNNKLLEKSYNADKKINSKRYYLYI